MTSAAAPAVNFVQYEDGWSNGDTVVGGPTYWVYCHDDFGTNLIYLQDDHNSCGTPGSTIGFASMTVNSNGSHTIEVCALDSIAASYFTEVVNPANPDGSATGETIWYTNYPDTGALPGAHPGIPDPQVPGHRRRPGFSNWLLP